VLPRQVFYHLSHTPSSFHFSYFSDKVLCFLPRVALDGVPPTYASHVARDAGVYHHI
jgi:hypothetical protein